MIILSPREIGNALMKTEFKGVKITAVSDHFLRRIKERRFFLNDIIQILKYPDAVVGWKHNSLTYIKGRYGITVDSAGQLVTAIIYNH